MLLHLIRSYGRTYYISPLPSNHPHPHPHPPDNDSLGNHSDPDEQEALQDDEVFFSLDIELLQINIDIIHSLSNTKTHALWLQQNSTFTSNLSSINGTNRNSNNVNGKDKDVDYNDEYPIFKFNRYPGLLSGIDPMDWFSFELMNLLKYTLTVFIWRLLKIISSFPLSSCLVSASEQNNLGSSVIDGLTDFYSELYSSLSVLHVLPPVRTAVFMAITQRISHHFLYVTLALAGPSGSNFRTSNSVSLNMQPLATLSNGMRLQMIISELSEIIKRIGISDSNLILQTQNSLLPLKCLAMILLIEKQTLVKLNEHVLIEHHDKKAWNKSKKDANKNDLDDDQTRPLLSRSQSINLSLFSSSFPLNLVQIYHLLDSYNALDENKNDQVPPSFMKMIFKKAAIFKRNFFKRHLNSRTNNKNDNFNTNHHNNIKRLENDPAAPSIGESPEAKGKANGKVKAKPLKPLEPHSHPHPHPDPVADPESEPQPPIMKMSIYPNPKPFSFSAKHKNSGSSASSHGDEEDEDEDEEYQEEENSLDDKLNSIAANSLSDQPFLFYFTNNQPSHSFTTQYVKDSKLNNTSNLLIVNLSLRNILSKFLVSSANIPSSFYNNFNFTRLTGINITATSVVNQIETDFNFLKKQDSMLL